MTVQKNGKKIDKNISTGDETEVDRAYFNTQVYQMALKSNPDIFVFMLGTNDAKSYNWDQKNFTKDFIDIVQTLKNVPSQPEVFVMIPPPLYQDLAFDIK